MALPTSTYRLQFRQGMTFRRASKLVPYLARIGVSHVYTSPIMKAVKGSTHGYDVVDFNVIEPVLGGMEGFNVFCEVLRRHGLEIIIDIVPNHMAASVENPWWHDVLAQGMASPYSQYFDIDWRRRLTIPVLRQQYCDEVSRGAFTLTIEQDCPCIRYGDVSYPLCSGSELSSAVMNGSDLDTLARSKEFMIELHAAQAYEMIPWRDASRTLSYRRFFEISGLVGLRVEERQVFEEVHRLVLELVNSGQVGGLRVDHVDGLVDPAGYLDRLRAATGPDVFIVVEKILVKGERLPQWPIAGTTGYEFIDASSAVFVSRKGLRELGDAYERIAPDTSNLELARRKAQSEMVRRHFVAEVERLVEIAQTASGQTGLKPAIEEVLICFPRYRTYLSDTVSSTADQRILAQAVASALRGVNDAALLDTVAELLLTPAGQEGVEFRDRFQQLTGPVLAKAVEDTLFYRYTRCLALNEVGCEAEVPSGGIDGFHANMLERLSAQPSGLSATSTHDTKWSEDARCRLLAITEDAGSWSSQFERWKGGALSHLEDRLDANTEWMLFQALFALLPAELSSASLTSLYQRFLTYVVKAAREAKMGTSWLAVNEEYETRLRRFVEGIFSPRGKPYLEEFHTFSTPFMLAGLVNSQVLTLLKLVAPGVPDFYQGCEYLKFELVDPDNRQPLQANYPDRSTDNSPASLAKYRLIKEGLKLRRARPQLFARGDYVPLRAMGRRAEKVIAFARYDRHQQVVAIGSTQMLRHVHPHTLGAERDFWQDTVVELPEGLSHENTDLVTGRTFLKRRISLDRALEGGPTAILVPLPHEPV